LLAHDDIFQLGEQGGLELSAGFGRGPRIIDLSLLALDEEDTRTNVPNGSDDNPSAMQELSDWRRRRRQLRTSRLGGFSSIRRGQMRRHRDRTILPLSDDDVPPIV
jgi:hypothetical protein